MDETRDGEMSKGERLAALMLYIINKKLFKSSGSEHSILTYCVSRWIKVQLSAT